MSFVSYLLRNTRILRQKAGIFLERERSILFIGDKSSYKEFEPIIRWVGANFPRIRIVLCGDREAVASLASSLSFAVHHLTPYPLRIFTKRFLKTVSPRCLIFLNDVRYDPVLLAVARRAGYPTVGLRSAPAELDEGPEAAEKTAPAYDEEIVLDPNSQDLRQSPLAAALKVLLALEFRSRRIRPRFSLPRIVLSATQHSRWKSILRWRIQRISDLDQLSQAIGRPNVIMCLGNGPSSAEPALAHMQKDALFRVNYSWAVRGYMKDPHVIFTGSTDAIVQGADAVIATQNLDGELRVIRHRALSFRHRARFARVQDLTASLSSFDWDGRWPTNGAAMIAVATAMQPQKLIIAGIDLFKDERGAYPGDDITPNTYTPKHSMSLEEQFILSCLQNYEGELVIVSDVLREVWEARGKEAPCAALSSRDEDAGDSS